MMIINGGLEAENRRKFNDTFRMIPVRSDCPYNEAIFDPEKKILFVISKQKEENIAKIKNSSRFYEYAIITHEDIKNFIDAFAVNREFDYSRYLN